MHPFLVTLFVLLAGHSCASVLSTSVSDLTSRQSTIASDCNATCGVLAAVKSQCDGPHCGCTVAFLQAQGDCLVCQTDTPDDTAAIQFLLDSEMAQCHSEGIKVQFQLQLPAPAAAIVQMFNHKSEQLRQKQTAFLALQVIGGHVGLVLLLLFGIFSSNVQRDTTFINFCVAWIFSSVVFSFPLYGGTEDHTIINPLGLISQNKCLAQAILSSGAQVMSAASTLAWIIQLWLSLRSAIRGDIIPGPKILEWVKYGLIVTPYLFLMFSLFIVSVGVTGTPLEQVLPSTFYCVMIRHGSFMRGVSAATLGILLPTLIFDAFIIKMLYRHWRAFRSLPRKKPLSLSVLVRVMSFSVLRVLVVGAYGSVLVNPPSPQNVKVTPDFAVPTVEINIPEWIDLLQAAIPLIAFFIIGTNTDVIRSLRLNFWHRKPPDEGATGASALEAVKVAREAGSDISTKISDGDADSFV